MTDTTERMCLGIWKLKGTVSVISSNPPCKDGKSSTLRSIVFVSLKCLFTSLVVSMQTLLANFLRIRSNGKIYRNKHFLIEKNDEIKVSNFFKPCNFFNTDEFILKPMELLGEPGIRPKP